MKRPRNPYEYEPHEGGTSRGTLGWMALAAGLADWFWRKWAPRKAADEVHPEGVRHGHTPEYDTQVRMVAAFGAALLMLLVAMLAGAWGLMSLYQSARSVDAGEGDPYSGAPPPTTIPQLQTDPAVDLLNVRQREDSLLRGYAWVDRGAGVARIPIGRAMELIAERSLSAAVGDSIVILTESGPVRVQPGVPPPSSAPYHAMSPETHASSPEIAEILGFVRSGEKDLLLQGRSADDP